MIKTKKSITMFLLICFAISSIFYYLMIVKRMLEFSTILMCCPGIAGIIVSLMYHRGENAVMIRKAKSGYLLLACTIPLLYWGISYGIYILLYGQNVIKANILSELLKKPLMLLITIAVYFFTALGEEIGWRGYLMPKLNEIVGAKKASLYCGIVWFLWHLPVFLASYMSQIPLWYQIPILLGLILSISYPMGYLSLCSHSVWPSAIFHAVHNFVSQLVLDQSIGGSLRPYLVGETGIISLFVAFFVALVIYKYFVNRIYDSSVK